MSREMKNSGIPWIGEIPKDWKCSSLKYFIDCLDGKRVPLDAGSRIKGEYPYWGAGNIVDYVNDYLFDEELVLLGEDGAPFFDKSRPVAFWVNEKMWANNHIHVLKPLPTVCAKYLVHFLNTVEYKCYINGSILPKLTQGNMNTIPMILPSLAEQQRIAEFLDRKCTEVDEMIALQEQIIDELKAYKQSVITEAVTKGLNPAAPMRDSGIEWIGSIPEHWKGGQFWRLNYIRGRLGWKGLKAEEYQEVGYPFLSAFNIINDKLDWNEINRITQERYDESPEIKLSKGDLLIVKDGAGIGKCARIDNLPLGEATVNSSLAVITPNEHLNYKFEYYYLLSAPFQSVIWLLKIGMGVPHLTQENMRSISMVYPSITEQQAIADYLDEKCADIDSLIQTKQSKIDSLKEYKKSIIYEYVTGKLEVK